MIPDLGKSHVYSQSKDFTSELKDSFVSKMVCNVIWTNKALLKNKDMWPSFNHVLEL